MASTENLIKEKADHPVEDKADHYEENKADHHEGNKADHHAEKKADHPVKEKADHSVEKKLDHPVEKKADHPVEIKADHPVEKKADHLIEKKGDHPTEKIANHPVENNADRPVKDKPDCLGEDKADHPQEDQENHPVENKEVHPIADKADHPVEDKAPHLANDKADHLVKEKVDHLPEEAKNLLKSLASKWDGIQDADAMQVIPLQGAMTNKVYQIKWPTKTEETSRKVIVRIYGDGVDNFFERDDEIRTFEFLSKNEQGPRLLGRFSNGRVEEYIKARTLTASDLRDLSISTRIAAKMKEFHDLDIPGPKKINLWEKLRKWISLAKSLSTPEEIEDFYMDTIEKEVNILEKEVLGTQQCIGFCHNDLQYGNIMLNEETNYVTLIDYEYSSYNPIEYDIANHFCEMAADYHTEKPHILDISKYPEFEDRKKFVIAYLSASGKQPSESEVEQLLQAVEKFTLASHLFWGLWGIISAHVNKIDFNYKEYAKQRIQQYWSRKPYLLCSAGPSLENIVTDGAVAASPSRGNPTTEHTSSIKSTPTKTPFFKKLKKVFGLSLFRSKN